MLSFWNFQWLLYLIFGQFNIHYVLAEWPPPIAPSVELLGLFEYTENASEAMVSSIQSCAMFKAAIVLSRQYNLTINGQYIAWQSAQTNGNIINALSSTCQAISDSNIVGIIGPDLSREAHIIAPFGQTVGIPIISYAATDPHLSDRNNYPSFYRTVPSDNAAALAIAKLFIQFNWTSCVIIYQNDAFGFGGAKVISEAFVNNGLIIKDLIVFDTAILDIQGDLKTLLTRSSTRIVVVWAGTSYTSVILQKALDSDVLAPHFTWIFSSRVPVTAFNQTVRQKLIGMLTVEPVTGGIVGAPTNTTLLNAAYKIWEQYEPDTFPGSTKVDNYALFAFDATWLLIQALQHLCSTIQNSSSSSCLSFIGSSFCFNRRFVYSDLLLNAVSATEFIGVSGPIGFRANSTDRINGSYYYAQNVQSTLSGVSFAPVLKYVDPGEWKTYTETSVIVWPGNSLTPPTDRAVLEGVTLRIGVAESPPFITITTTTDAFGNTTTKLIGYVPDLIELLRGKMGFIPDIRLAPSNQTYTGLIEDVADGVYDIVVGDVTITSKRRETVDFSTSIFDSSLRIMIRKTSAVDVDLLSYLKPFSRSLWLVVLAASIYAAILMYLLERIENEVLEKRSTVSAIAMSFWYSFGNIVGYGVDFHPRTAAGRLLTAGLYILSLVLVASYTANLASDLTISKSKDIISGVDDIKNGKIPFNRIGIFVGTPVEDYYLREISGGSRNFYPLKSYAQLYETLFAGIIDTSLVDIGFGEYITNNIYCNLTLVGTDFDRSAFGIVIPKQWLYTQDLDVNLLALKEAGDLDDLKIKWFQSTICPAAAETTTAMGIAAMGGLFVTFAVITVLALCIFVWKKRHMARTYLCRLFDRKTL